MSSSTKGTDSESTPRVGSGQAEALQPDTLHCRAKPQTTLLRSIWFIEETVPSIRAKPYLQPLWVRIGGPDSCWSLNAVTVFCQCLAALEPTSPSGTGIGALAAAGGAAQARGRRTGPPVGRFRQEAARKPLEEAASWGPWACVQREAHPSEPLQCCNCYFQVLTS